MALTLITAPTTEPLTLAEAKAFCRVTSSDEDTLITSLIVAARRRAEVLTGRVLITQTWEQTFDVFDYCLELQKSPVQSVTSVKYYDTAGVQQTVDTAIYQTDVLSPIARVLPKFTQWWPLTDYGRVNAVSIRFIAGYGNAAGVPDDVKTWMKVAISTFYKQRESIVVGLRLEDISTSFIDGLLDSVRLRP